MILAAHNFVATIKETDALRISLSVMVSLFQLSLGVAVQIAFNGQNGA